MTVVNNATAITTTTINGVDYVNINGSKTQVIKGNVTFPAAATATVPGTLGNVTVTVGGTYVAGDQVRVSLSLPASNRITKSYVHTVVSGGVALNVIAVALAALIAADVNAGLPGLAAPVVPAGAVVTLIQDGTQGVILTNNVVAYTDSALGTVAVASVATVRSQGTPADLLEEGVDAGVIGLATYSTVLLKNSVNAAIPFIDSEGKTVKEIKFYSTPAICAALIAAL
tara:strand:+ start:146 stop:829 length:684 start_codon:yes stop_codon:yes gene_type:complete